MVSVFSLRLPILVSGVFVLTASHDVLFGWLWA